MHCVPEPVKSLLHGRKQLDPHYMTGASWIRIAGPELVGLHGGVETIRFNIAGLDPVGTAL